jgi:hypothetical protein
LSRIEAEYVAISEAVKEINIMYFLIRDIEIDVELPIVVKTDNIGLSISYLDSLRNISDIKQAFIIVAIVT